MVEQQEVGLRLSDANPQRRLDLHFAQVSKEQQRTGENVQTISRDELATVMDPQMLRVMVRIRGPREEMLPSCIRGTTETGLVLIPPEGHKARKAGTESPPLTFSRVIGPNASQAEVFSATAAPMVQRLLTDGRSSTMIAYGMIGAGKTFTMEGGDTGRADPEGRRSQWGVIQRALEAIFEDPRTEEEELTVHVSHYEVFEEKVYDLLPSAKSRSLPIGPRRALNVREDSHGRVYVDGLTEEPVKSLREAWDCLLERSCKQERAQGHRAKTGLRLSSRSHSVVVVRVCRPLLDIVPGGSLEGSGFLGDRKSPQGTLTFVDLAGKEHASKAGDMGDNMLKSKTNSRSLYFLEQCIDVLKFNVTNSAGEIRKIPWRSSKITHLFRNVLHARGAVLLCVNVSPAPEDYDDTARVLSVAQQAWAVSSAETRRVERDLEGVLRPQSPSAAKRHLAQPQPRQLAAKPQPVVRAPPAAAPSRAQPPGAGSTAQTASAAGSKAALPTCAAAAPSGRVAALQAEVKSLTEKLALMEAQQMRGDAERLARMHDEIHDEIHKEMSDSFTQLWQEAVDREQDAYAAKELALKQKHEAEVKALQEQLQNASKRPASRKGRAGKAGCPGKDNLLEKADHLQDENATLKEQLQAAQQVTEQLQQQLSQAAQSAQDASDLSHQLEALRKSAEDDNQRFQEELLAVADKERAHAEELRAQQQQQHGQVLEECEQLLSLRNAAVLQMEADARKLRMKVEELRRSAALGAASLEGQKKLLAAEVGALSRDRDQWKRQCEALRSESSQAEEGRAAAAQQLQACQERLTAANAALEAETVARQAAQRDAEALLAEAGAQKLTLQSKLAAADAALDAETLARAAAQHAATTAQTRAAELEAALSEQTAARQAAEQRMQEAEARVAWLETALQDHMAGRRAAEQGMQAAEARVSELDSALQRLMVARLAAQQASVEFEVELLDAQTTAEVNAEEVTRLMGEVARLMGEAAAHKAAREFEREIERLDLLEEAHAQAQANTLPKVEMLNHQLDQAQKEILRLKAQLAHRPGTSANPAVLRTATAEGQASGPKGRGAAGTPHNIALARARAAVMLSPQQSPLSQEPAPTPEGAAEAGACPQGVPSTAAQKRSALSQKTPDALDGPGQAASAPQQAAAESAQHPMPSHAAHAAAMPDQQPLTTKLPAAAAGRDEGGQSQAVDGSAAPIVPEPARQLPAFPAPPAAMTRTRRRTMAVSSQSEGVAKHAAKKPSEVDAVKDNGSAAEHGHANDVAMSLSRVPAQASVEAPRKARLTRRATMAVSAAMAGKRSAAEAACVAQQVDGPAAAGRGRAGGASMALMPDPASEPDGDCPGPGLSKRQKRRKTTASRLAGVPEQDADSRAPADAEQPAPALDTIVESDTEEGGACPSLQAKAAATQTAAPAAQGSLSHGMPGQAAAQDQAGRIVATGDATAEQAPTISNGPRQPCSRHQRNGSSAVQGRPEGVGAGEQGVEPARRSLRRCTMAARPGSAYGQAGRPGSALSPVLEHSQAPPGMLAPAQATLRRSNGRAKSQVMGDTSGTTDKENVCASAGTRPSSRRNPKNGLAATKAPVKQASPVALRTRRTRRAGVPV